MAPFFLLLALLALVALDLVRHLFWRARLRGAPFVRQPPRAEDEPDWLLVIRQAAGPQLLVFPSVAAAAVLRPGEGLARGQRRLADSLLRDGVLDYVLAAADGYPLCVVQLLPKRTSAVRRAAGDALMGACAAAGLPVVALAAEAPPPRATLAKLIADAMALAERHEVVAPPPELDDDEEDALARLSATMREPDPAGAAR